MLTPFIARKLDADCSSEAKGRTKAVHGGRLRKTSRRGEMVRDPRRDAETFWAEAEARPRHTVQWRDVEHFVRDETETSTSQDRDVETETTSPEYTQSCQLWVDNMPRDLFAHYTAQL